MLCDTACSLIHPSNYLIPSNDTHEMADLKDLVISEEGETPNAIHQTSTNGATSANKPSTNGQTNYFDAIQRPGKAVIAHKSNGSGQTTPAPISPTSSHGNPNTSGTRTPELQSANNATRPPLESKESHVQTTTKKTISRLQRMFSQTGRKDTSMTTSKDSTAVTTPNGARTPDEQHPPAKDPEKEERVKHMTAEEKVVAMRFDYYEKDGTHAHHLRKAKREEKLKNMLKDMLGGRAKREEEERKAEQEEAHALSLITSWVDQAHVSEDAEATKIAKAKDPHQHPSLLEKYGRCQEIIGRGAFGIVRVSHKPDPEHPGKEKLYAVKEFRRKPTESDKKYTKRLTSEFCISSSLRHPNVIHTLDLLQDNKGDYCEVMEFCAGGDLYTLILAAGKLELAEADCYFKQLMRGVKYLHQMGVAHRDLKPENLLLTPSGAVKIADFGNGECFRMAWEKESHMTAGLCGSAPYIAPEEYTEKEFSPAGVDVWACGVIFMAMRTGRHLWRMARRDEDEFFARYLEGRKTEGGYEPIEALSRARCRNVIYSMLDPNPRRRLTSAQVLDSEWLQGIWTCKAGDVGA